MLGFHLLTTSAVKPVLSKSVIMLEVAGVAAGVCNRRWSDKLSGPCCLILICVKGEGNAIWGGHCSGQVGNTEVKAGTIQIQTEDQTPSRHDLGCQACKTVNQSGQDCDYSECLRLILAMKQHRFELTPVV